MAHVVEEDGWSMFDSTGFAQHDVSTEPRSLQTDSSSAEAHINHTKETTILYTISNNGAKLLTENKSLFLSMYLRYLQRYSPTL